MVLATFATAVLSWNLILTSSIAAAGIWAGVLLGVLAKYELKPGRAWFARAQALLAALIALLGLLALNASHWLAVVLASAAFLVMLFRPQLKKDLATYLASGAFIGLSYGSQFGSQFAVQIAALAFAYGLPTGALLRLLYKKKWPLHALVKSVALLAAALIVGAIVAL